MRNFGGTTVDEYFAKLGQYHESAIIEMEAVLDELHSEHYYQVQILWLIWTQSK